MYLFYQNDEAQIEIIVPEENFFKAVEGDFSRIIALFNSYENRNLKIYPQTTKEGEWMLYAYSELMSLQQPLPKWLLLHFHISFSHILAGAPIAKALRLVNAAHRPAESYVAERNEKIYLDVISLMNNGMALFEAALELADKYELHESNIQKIYSAIKKTKTPSENSDDEIDLPF
jgi:hypothetical protein